MKRKDRRPKVIDIGKYIDRENIESLKATCGFEPEFDLYSEVREFVDFLVGEIEKARQTPSLAEVKRDIQVLEKSFTQQLKCVSQTKEIIETIPNLTRSFLYHPPSSPSDFFQLYDNLDSNIKLLITLKNACSQAREEISKIESMDEVKPKKSAINLPDVVARLLKIFIGGVNGRPRKVAVKPTCYSDSHSKTGYSGHFYKFVVELDSRLIKEDDRLYLGAPSTIGDAISTFMKK